MRSFLWPTALVAGFLSANMLGQGFIFHGKVVMVDGTPPPKSVLIERYCGTGRVSALTRTASNGTFTVKLADFNPFQSTTQSVKTGFSVISCVLRADLSGYESSNIELDSVRPLGDPNLPPLTLRKRGTEQRGSAETSSIKIPRRIQAAWQRVAQEVHDNQWQRAEAHAREVVAVEPQFAPGWTLLGVVAQKLGRPEDSREYLLRAIQADPKTPEPRFLLLQSEVSAGQWQAVRKSTAELMRIDTNYRYRQVYLYDAIARFNLGDLDGAQASASEAVRLDAERQMTRAEYVLGRVSESRAEFPQAIKHYKRYLELTPNASDAAALRERIRKIESGEAVDSAPALAAVQLDFSIAGEVWLPGGTRALARISHVEADVSPEDFFAAYCRTLVRNNTLGNSDGISGYLATLRAYFAAVSELAREGEPRGGVRVRLSLAPDDRKNTARVLELFGWRLIDDTEGVRVELGDTAADGARQPIPGALGIDAVEMQDALNAGRSFEFEIRSDRTRLFGGEAWLDMIRDRRSLQGGLAEAFANDPRLAKAYAGLSAMPNSTVEFLINALGARNIVSRYADLLFQNASNFDVVNGTMVAPGGPSAEAAWEGFAGISPRDAAAFTRALLDKDGGTAAAFYSAVKRATSDRQRFFAARSNLRIAYGWFMQAGIDRASALIRDLPLDASGSLRLPGGVRVWTGAFAESGALPDAAAADRITALAGIEDARRVPLDEDSARLILQRFEEWRPIFPYFEKISGLGPREFRALDTFTNTLRQQTPEQRNLALGAWYSIAELIAMARSVPSNDARAVEAFRRACDPSPTAATIESAFRVLMGDLAHIDESAIAKLLGFDGGREQEFKSVLEVQKAPSIQAAFRSRNAAQVVEALTGIIYAAAFRPTGLLVSEDRELVRKHRFAATRDALFAPATLTSGSEGSRISGGFLNLASLAGRLADGGQPESAPTPSESSRAHDPTVVGEETPSSRGMVFRADVRLVMVAATVTDQRDRYVDDLLAPDFEVLEDGQFRPPVGFESFSSGVSCALLLDTTGSMYPALPALKSAALRFIRDLRSVDSVAVYGFSDSVSLLQPFTSDKSAAKRAVLGTRAAGNTALYDALTRVTRDLSARPGKKVIVLFTDGEDNLSTLTAKLAIQRCKSTGVPVYTIAQGQALGSPALLTQLSEVSSATGGLPFRVQRAADIKTVFERISSDLTHGYLLTFQPPTPSSVNRWHRLDVLVRRDKTYKVRAREGYFTE